MLIWHLWEAQAQGLVLVSIWEALAGEGGCGMRGIVRKPAPEPFLLHQEQLKLPVETKRPWVCEKDTCAAAGVVHFEKTSPYCCIPGEQ